MYNFINDNSNRNCTPSKDYYSLYIKYKMKYLNLKKSNLNQVAGGSIRHLKTMIGSSMNSINKNILISEYLESNNL